MASTTIFGLSLTFTPTALTALRIAPLLSTTASLTHAYMEWLTNSSFIGPAPVDSSLSRFLTNTSSREARITNLETPAIKQAQQEVEAAKELVVPEWFTHFFNTGVLSVIGFNNLTLMSAALNIAFSEGLGESKIFYQAGVGFAAAHYAFVPLVASSVSALIGMAARRRKGEGSRTIEGDKGAVGCVNEWVGWHTVRMSTVDVMAWGCFAWGAINTLTVVPLF
ncbi:hypothetical protein E8E12_001305 [Didymella heteroderae]|uniref:Uncharacterized protein n=1 Tax=Didymella heteroderae TaxID=1769908 RepID=A0A9P4WXL5_9PLEO|nr:hypothetical protein E8E12_001305 [Didymella heteroderae]